MSTAVASSEAASSLESELSLIGERLVALREIHARQEAALQKSKAMLEKQRCAVELFRREHVAPHLTVVHIRRVQKCSSELTPKERGLVAEVGTVLELGDDVEVCMNAFLRAPAESLEARAVELLEVTMGIGEGDCPQWNTHVRHFFTRFPLPDAFRRELQPLFHFLKNFLHLCDWETMLRCA